MDFGVKGPDFRSWLWPGQFMQPLLLKDRVFSVPAGLSLRIWTAVMKSRTWGVENWALPAVRASEASDFTISLIFYPDANSNRQRLLPFPLPKLLSQINVPRWQTIFIVGNWLHFSNSCFQMHPCVRIPNTGWMDSRPVGWMVKSMGLRIRKN